MKGAGDLPTVSSENLGRWWWDAEIPRNDLMELENIVQTGRPVHPLWNSAPAEQIESYRESVTEAWRHVYDSGESVRAALRKASGSDEIVLYRGQPNKLEAIPSDEIADLLEQTKKEIMRANPLRGEPPDFFVQQQMEQVYGGFDPPQIVESYSPLVDKALSFSDLNYGQGEILARRVKIEDIVGTLGRTPEGTSEFVVLNPMTLSGQTMQAITGRVTTAPLLQSRVDLEQIAGKLRDVTERSRRGEFRGGLR